MEPCHSHPAATTATTTSQPLSTDPLIASMARDVPWYGQLLQLQQAIVAEVSSAIPGGLRPAKTKYSRCGGDGSSTDLVGSPDINLLRLRGLPPPATASNGSSSSSSSGSILELRTYEGQWPLAWGYQAQAIFAIPNTPIKLVYFKVSVHLEPPGGTGSSTGSAARAPLVTPSLDVEFSGTSSELLVWASLSPRLALPGNPAYCRKYYMSVPPSSTASGTNGSTPPEPALLSFTDLEKRVRGRTQQYSQPLKPGAASSAASPPVYKGLYSSPDFNVRCLAPAALAWTWVPPEGGASAPADQGPMPSVEQDVMGLVKLWAAWLQHDLAAAGTPAAPQQALSPQQLQSLNQWEAALQGPGVEAECERMSWWLRRVIEFEPDTARTRAVFGEEGAKQLIESITGDARL